MSAAPTTHLTGSVQVRIMDDRTAKQKRHLQIVYFKAETMIFTGHGKRIDQKNSLMLVLEDTMMFQGVCTNSAKCFEAGDLCDRRANTVVTYLASACYTVGIFAPFCGCTCHLDDSHAC